MYIQINSTINSIDKICMYLSVILELVLFFCSFLEYGFFIICARFNKDTGDSEKSDKQHISLNINIITRLW